MSFCDSDGDRFIVFEFKFNSLVVSDTIPLVFVYRSQIGKVNLGAMSRVLVWSPAPLLQSVPSMYGYNSDILEIIRQYSSAFTVMSAIDFFNH